MNDRRSPPALFAVAVLLLAAASAGQEITLTVLDPPRGNGHRALARGGMALSPAQEAIDPAEFEVVGKGGAARPSTFRVLARRPGTGTEKGAPRWLLVTAAIEEEDGASVAVVRRPVPRPATPPLGFDADTGRIDTGTLAVVLGDGAPVLVAELGTAAVIAARELRLVAVLPSGERREFKPGRAEIEGQDELSLSLRWRGPLTDDLRATVRMVVEKRTRFLRLSVRLENPGTSLWGEQFECGKPKPAHLKALLVELRPPEGSAKALDGDRAEPRPLPVTVDLPVARVSENDFEKNLVFSAKGPDGDHRGTHHLGAIGVLGSGAGLAIARRAAAFEAPNRFVIESGLVRVELLSTGGSGPHFGGQYGDPKKKSPVVDPESLTSFRLEGGLWKTFDLGLLPVAGAMEPRQIGDLLRAIESPPLLTLPPGPATEFAKDFFHAAPFQDPAPTEAARLQRMLRMLVDDRAADPQERVGQIGLPAFLNMGGPWGGYDPYGWFNYGDLPWSEGFCSLHYDWPRTMFASYLASSDRRFFDRGLVMASHQRDIDLIHTDPMDRLTGAQRYEKGWWHGNYYFPVQSHLWITGLTLFHLLTGDPGAREALDQAGEYLLRQKLGEWSGLYGARMIGWPVDSLLSLWLLDGDPRYLAAAKAGLEAFERHEKLGGGKGFHLDAGSEWAPNNWPNTCQTWQHAILLLAGCRYVNLSGDQTLTPLLRRVADFLAAEAFIPATEGAAGFVPAKVWEFWAPGHHRHPSIHLGWIVQDGLSEAALLFKDPTLFAPARQLFDSLARFHQGASPGHRPVFNDPSSYSPIAARMLNYPNSESKILGNIGRFGLGHLWIRARLGAGK